MPLLHNRAELRSNLGLKGGRWGVEGMVGNSVGIYRPVGAHPLQIWTSGVLLQNRNTQFTMERDQLCYGGKVIHFIKCGPDWRFCKREIQRVQRDEIQSTTKYKYTITLSTKERYTMCNEIRSNLLSTTCVSLATVMRGTMGKSVAKTTDEHIFENIC